MIITLDDILYKDVNEIINKANSSIVHKLDDAENINVIKVYEYKESLFTSEVYIGKKFFLNSGYEVEIVGLKKKNNKVLVKFVGKDKIININYFKLIKKSTDESNFDYKIGDKYLYLKKNDNKIITISFLNPSQNAIGFIENNKKVFVKVTKLKKINEE